MKVILLDNIKKVGRKFDTVKVADGYGTNYLIPKGLARAATKEAEKAIAEKRKIHEKEMAVQSELLTGVLETLKGTPISIVAPANNKGHLFAGIHQKEIADAIERTTRVTIPLEAIVLDGPIKEVGEHKVILSLPGGEGGVVVTITAEESK